MYYSDPLVTDRASMQHLWDVEGNKYLDFFGGIVTISVGHANPRVTSKIKAAGGPSIPVGLSSR
jgi:4-aminobutyrate aminotransferase-like enzyme